MQAMVIQETILSAYGSIIKRIRSWLIPLVMLLLIGTAYGRSSSVVLSYFTAIELASIHFFLGWLMGLIWLVLGYDFIFNLISRPVPSEEDSSRRKKRFQKPNSLTRLVNTIFYLMLFLICVSGLLQYYTRIASWHSVQLYRVNINLIHISLAWLFISTALIKYYLTITQWLESLFRYLRED